MTVEPTEDELKANRNITGYIIDTAGNHLERFTLDEGQKFYENSYFGSFQVKYDAFKLMFVAYSKDGQRIERVLPRVIKPQVFEVQISVENSSLIFTPGERASITVALRNYGKRSNFAVVVYDDKSFIESYSPHNVIVPSNDTVNIKIIFLAPLSTNDSNTTSVSVSAFIESEEAADLANFLTFEASVFSKVLYDAQVKLDGRRAKRYRHVTLKQYDKKSINHGDIRVFSCSEIEHSFIHSY